MNVIPFAKTTARICNTAALQARWYCCDAAAELFNSSWNVAIFVPVHDRAALEHMLCALLVSSLRWKRLSQSHSAMCKSVTRSTIVLNSGQFCSDLLQHFHNIHSGIAQLRKLRQHLDNPEAADVSDRGRHIVSRPSFQVFASHAEVVNSFL